MPHLITPRLTLRPLVAADLDALQHTLLDDPAVLRHWPQRLAWPTPLARRAALQRAFHTHVDGGWFAAELIVWAIERGGQLAGCCGLVLPEPARPAGAARRDSRRDGPALVVVLGCAHQGLGLATEAAFAVLDDAAARLRLRAVHACAGTDNREAQRLYARCGFALQPAAAALAASACGQPLMGHWFRDLTTTA